MISYCPCRPDEERVERTKARLSGSQSRWGNKQSYYFRPFASWPSTNPSSRRSRPPPSFRVPFSPRPSSSPSKRTSPTGRIPSSQLWPIPPRPYFDWRCPSRWEEAEPRGEQLMCEPRGHRRSRNDKMLERWRDCASPRRNPGDPALLLLLLLSWHHCDGQRVRDWSSRAIFVRGHSRESASIERVDSRCVLESDSSSILPLGWIDRVSQNPRRWVWFASDVAGDLAPRWAAEEPRPPLPSFRGLGWRDLEGLGEWREFYSRWRRKEARELSNEWSELDDRLFRCCCHRGQIPPMTRRGTATRYLTEGEGGSGRSRR